MKRLLFTSLLLSLSLSCSLSFSMGKPKEKPDKTAEQEQLKLAIIENNIEKIEKILKKNPEFAKQETNRGWTRLHWLIRKKDKTEEDKIKFLKLFINLGANPERATENKNTPLHFACWYGHLEIVKYLVEEVGVNMHCRNNKSMTPLGIAKEKNQLDIIEYLEPIVFDQAIKKDNAFKLSQILFDNPELAEKTKGLFQDFVKKGKIELVKLLVSQETDEKNRKKMLECGLEIAETKGCSKIKNYLSLNLAIENNDIPIANQILLQGDNLFETEYLFKVFLANFLENEVKDGLPVLHLLAKEGKLELFKIFTQLKYGDPERMIKHGIKPLDIASKYGQFEFVKYLVEKLKVDISPDALDLAKKHEHKKIIEYLEQKEEEKKHQEHQQELLKEAIAKYDLECDSNNKEDLLKKIGIILDSSPELVNKAGNQTFNSPITLLFAAEGKLELLKLFISKGADPEKRDLMEFNTLDVAVNLGRDKIVKYLVEEVGLKISNNLVGFAQKQGHKKIAKYLQEKQNERNKELMNFIDQNLQ